MVITAVLLLNSVLRRLQEAKAEDAVAAVGRLTQTNATVLRNRRVQHVPSAALVVGIVLLMSDVRGAADVMPVLLLGVSLAVAAVPEGLPDILSLVLTLGVQRMARHNAIMKSLSTVETLRCASVIASDKTSTLVRAEMTIQSVVTASGSRHITGVGYAPERQVELGATKLAGGAVHEEQNVVLSGGSLASNAHLQQADGGA